jgi:hypothetical protein
MMAVMRTRRLVGVSECGFMLSRLDEQLCGAANRAAGWLQQDCGLTMPAILRQAATATIMATLLAIVATLLMRGPVHMAITLVFGAITIGSFWTLLKRYNRDAERDWTSDLARDYAVRAIGTLEGQRRVREIGLAFSLVALMLTLMMVGHRPLDLVDLTMIALIGSTLAHMYLSCAEPRPPGMGRRQPKLAMAGAGG